MPNIIPIVGANRTFSEDATSLNGKEDLLLELNADGTVKLNTGSAPIGVCVGKLQNGQPEVNVRLLKNGGSFRCVQSAAIVPGALVMVDPANPTKVITWAASAGINRPVLGVKLADSSNTANGAAGDVIEVLDAPQSLKGDAPAAFSVTQSALTDNSGGTANTTVEACGAAVTGVDGTGSNAASKADVDARLAAIANNIADLAAQLNAARTDMVALKVITDAAGITTNP